MDGIHRINGGCVVVRTFSALTPVAHDQIHIQEPALHFVLSRLNRGNGVLTEGDWRNAGQTR